MKKLIVLSFVLCVFLSFNAQPSTKVSQPSTLNAQPYTPPMTHEISLAGNFGEPRPNHFHGGLDLTTQREEGKGVRAIADGYVSRIIVSLTGCGNAIYITHTDGYTSAYFHLQRFTPRLERILKKYQYAHEQHEVDFRLPPSACPVAQGQLVAFSGNTGASYGPHLHLEMIDTHTGVMYDPMEWLGTYINDTVPPRVHGIMVYPQRGAGIFNGSQACQQVKGDSATAWGRIGFAMWADDYMQNASNHYGIRHTSLLVDGREVFNADVNGISPRQNRMVNVWGDYDYYYRKHDWYLKSFIEPGNRLSILHADENRGIVDINEERDYQFEYVLTDYFGNRTSYPFKVKGKRRTIPSVADSLTTTIRWNRTTMVSLPGMQLVVPRGNLGDDVKLLPQVTGKGMYSSAYRVCKSASCPLFCGGELSIRLTSPVDDPSKVYIVSRAGKSDKEGSSSEKGAIDDPDNKGSYVGGTFADGWVTARIRDIGGIYALAYDNEAPDVELVVDGIVLKANVKDKGCGVRSYKAYVDGQFVLFKRLPRSNQIVCRLTDTPLRRMGTSRQLKFTAVDQCGNERTTTTNFKY